MEGRSNLCPRCYNRGVRRELLMLNSGAGSISNLCSSSTCNYPFAEYDTLCASIRKALDENAETEQTMEDFLNELLGDSRDGSDPSLETLGNSNQSPESMFADAVSKAYPQFSTVDEKSTSSSLFSSTQEAISVSVSNNCLLPRYLADSLKRVNSTHHRQRLKRTGRSVLGKSSNLKGRSCDSGVSISSDASPSTTYEEHIRQLKPCASELSLPVVLRNRRGSSPETLIHRHPISLADHLVRLQQKRL